MNHAFGMTAWVSTPKGMIQLPVIVEYRHNGGRPFVHAIVEAADRTNDLSELISAAEKDFIDCQMATDLRAKQVEFAEALLEGDR